MNARNARLRKPYFAVPANRWRVLHRRLADRVAAHLHQRREEAVGAVEQLQALDRVGAVDLQAAGRVVDRLLADPVADAVGLAALPAAEVGVLPVLPPAGDHVDPASRSSSGSRRGISSGSFWRSASMVAMTSPRAASKPASNAADSARRSSPCGARAARGTCHALGEQLRACRRCCRRRR